MRKEEVAKLLGVDESAAYGFLRFLVAAGLVTVEKQLKDKGKRGRSATLYKFNKLTVHQLTVYLNQRLNPKTELEPVFHSGELAPVLEMALKTNED